MSGGMQTRSMGDYLLMTRDEARAMMREVGHELVKAFGSPAVKESIPDNSTLADENNS